MFDLVMIKFVTSSYPNEMSPCFLVLYSSTLVRYRLRGSAREQENTDDDDGLDLTYVLMMQCTRKQSLWRSFQNRLTMHVLHRNATTSEHPQQLSLWKPEDATGGR